MAEAIILIWYYSAWICAIVMMMEMILPSSQRLATAAFALMVYVAVSSHTLIAQLVR